jgi:hypothetical protein
VSSVEAEVIVGSVEVEVIVGLIGIGGIVDHHCLNFLFIIYISSM